MKSHLFLKLAVFLAILESAFCDETISFEKFKKLSKEERQTIIAAATLDVQENYKRWDGIVDFGGRWWDYPHADAFIGYKGFNGLASLANVQVNLFGFYELERFEAIKKGNEGKESQGEQMTALNKESAELKKERYNDRWWYLVRLAPTPEALSLNEKAKNLITKWVSRYSTVAPTREELKAINAAVKEIRDEVRKLPQLTPDQIEDGLAAIPLEQIMHYGSARSAVY